MKKRELVLLLLLSGGCGFIGGIADDFGMLVSAYCMLPDQEREVNRAVIDVATAPHKVRIECN